MTDVNKSALDKYVDEINSAGTGKAIGIYCDVRNYNDVKNACEKAYNYFGSIDIVANFAGGTAVLCKS